MNQLPFRYYASTLPRHLLTVLGACLFSAMTPLIVQAQVPAAPQWPDTYLARLQAQELLQTINAEILGSNSATLSLEKWCGDHKLAIEPKLIATLVHGVDKHPSAEQRKRLQVGPD